jgi:hypothetical protein
LNRDWVLYNLHEAREELGKTIQEITADPAYDYAEFLCRLQEVYQHLNTAWNARDAAPEHIARHTREEFVQWSQFPADLPMMGS